MLPDGLTQGIDKARRHQMLTPNPKRCHPSVHGAVPDSNRTYLIRPYSLLRSLPSVYRPHLEPCPLHSGGSRLFRLPHERFQDVGIVAQKRKRVNEGPKFLHQGELPAILMFSTRVMVSSGSSQGQLSTRPTFSHAPLGSTRGIN